MVAESAPFSSSSMQNGCTGCHVGMLHTHLLKHAKRPLAGMPLMLGIHQAGDALSSAVNL